MKCIEKNAFENTQKTNVKSGFPELDEITHGWNNGNLITIAGRPAMGKTAFGVSLLRNIAIENKISVAYFSLEMDNRQLMRRFLMTLSHVESEKISDYQGANFATLT